MDVVVAVVGAAVFFALLVLLGAVLLAEVVPVVVGPFEFKDISPFVALVEGVFAGVLGAEEDLPGGGMVGPLAVDFTAGLVAGITYYHHRRYIYIVVSIKWIKISLARGKEMKLFNIQLPLVDGVLLVLPLGVALLLLLLVFAAAAGLTAFDT